MKKSIIFFSIFFISKSFAQDSRLWGTYYGGVNADRGYNTATDNSGNVYMVGTTSSFSAIAYNGFDTVMSGGMDAFLVKFDASGNRIWATYFGGSGSEYGWNVATDNFGNVYISGNTTSTSGIFYSGFQSTYGGNTDAFLVKFDGNGNRIWATYFGGAGSDTGYGLTTDNTGNVYLSGQTQSDSLIASGGFQNTYGGGLFDSYLVKFDTNGNRIWATYYGGSMVDVGYRISTDSLRNVYLVGYTSSISSIASGGFQNIYAGGTYDAFLVKFDENGNRIWATYYGGSNYETAYGVATDISGNVYIVGYTNSTSSIASGGFQNIFGGSYDVFLVKFDGNGNRIWATYYGGTNAEEAGVVVTDISGNVYMSGDTYSSNDISLGGFQSSLIGSENAFVVKFDSDGNRLCSTYYGQNHDEEGAIGVDQLGNVYLTGQTNSSTGMSSVGGFQYVFGGNQDAYLVKFTSCTPTSVSENEKENLFTIYPNPTNSSAILQFKNPSKENCIFTLYDIHGRIVSTIKNITDESVKFERNNLINGLYFFQLYSAKTIITSGKLIINN